MKPPDKPEANWAELRRKIIGLGERSGRKSYYPELQRRLADLERFRALLDQARELIFMVEPASGRCIDVNETACRQLSYDRETILGMPLLNLVSPNARERLQSLFNQVGMASPVRRIATSWLRSRHGQDIPVEIEITEMSFEGVAYAALVAYDISERWEAEEVSQRYIERLQALHEIDRAILEAQSPEAVAESALGRLRRMIPCSGASVVEFDWRAGLARILAIDREGDPLYRSGQTVPADTLPLDILRQGQVYLVDDLGQQTALRPEEVTLLAQGGRSLLSVPLTAPAGLIGALNLVAAEPNLFLPDHLEIAREAATSLAVAIHHTRLYEQTHRDAATKTRLLDEVNHRVKNNLAAIIGMLYVERGHAGIAGQPAYQDTLADLINRIQGLATVHSLLSAAEWAPLNLAYLTSRVIATALQHLPAGQFTVRVSPSPVRITSGQATDLALVINELATNSAKYAFPTHGALAIQVSITSGEDGVSLEYRDDGPGYPAEVLSQANQNVGLYLVHNLVRQGLRGEITLANDGGAVARLRLPAL